MKTEKQREEDEFAKEDQVMHRAAAKAHQQLNDV